MKRIVAGILAHVDAGKTTLSEALLYATGQVRKLGRVDHGDAFLDTDAWNGSAASPSSPSRPSSPRPTSPSPCSILLATSTSPPKRNVRSPCSTTPSSSSPARTASKAIPKRCGDCSIAIRCPHSSSSTKWTRPAPTKRNCSPNSRNASRTLRRLHRAD